MMHVDMLLQGGEVRIFELMADRCCVRAFLFEIVPVRAVSRAALLNACHFIPPIGSHVLHDDIKHWRAYCASELDLGHLGEVAPRCSSRGKRDRRAFTAVIKNLRRRPNHNVAAAQLRCNDGPTDSATHMLTALWAWQKEGLNLVTYMGYKRRRGKTINEDMYAALIDQLEDKETRLDWIDDDQGDYGEWSQSDEDSVEGGYDAAAEAREKARDAFGNIDFKRLNGGRKRASAANDSEEKGAPSPERKRGRAALAVATVCLHTAEAWWNTRGAVGSFKFVTSWEWVCDVCNVEHSRDTPVFKCKICNDFDVCVECWGNKVAPSRR